MWTSEVISIAARTRAKNKPTPERGWGWIDMRALAMRHILLPLLLLLFSNPLLAQELVEFENGKVAYANDINGNFTEILDQISSLRDDLTFSTQSGYREVSVNCDVDGRTALQTAITENTSINSLARINATGACSAVYISGGRFQIIGSNGFRINREEEDVEKAFLVEVGPNAQLTLISATVDAGGSNFAFRNRGTTFLALTTVKNATGVNFETFTAAYTFGGVTLGDDDDIATAAMVAAGGVLANLFTSTFPQLTEAVLSLRGADRLLWVREGGYAALSLSDSRLDATGGSMLIEQSGTLRLAEASIQLSDGFDITTNANVRIIEGVIGGENTTATLLTDIHLSQGGTLNLDLSDTYQSIIAHTGTLTAELGSSVLVSGDASSANDLRLGLVPDGDETEGKFIVETGAQLRIENATLDRNLEVRSASLWLGNESVMSKGMNSITSSFGAHVLVDGEAPASEINCSTDGKAWAVSAGESLCGI